MTARQIQKLNSYLSLSLVCRDHIAIISIVPAMIRNVKEFEKLLPELIKFSHEQALPITHHAIQKFQIRKEMAKLLSELAGIVRAYCYEAKNLTVLHQFKFTYTGLCRKKDYKFRGTCAASLKFLDDNFDCFTDFGMKKNSTEKLRQLLKSFDKKWVSPHSAINHRIVMTKSVADKIEQIDHLLKNHMDNLLICYRQFPEFCKAFKAARKQIKYGRPKEVLKNKIKKYRSAPALPRTRKSSKPVLQLKPLVMPEIITSEQPENLQGS